MSDSSASEAHAALVARLRAGDPEAREELFRAMAVRLRRQARQMLYAQPDLAARVETDDVVQGALLRLARALQAVQPESARHLFRLAAQQLRWELHDVARHWFSPHGAGRRELPLPEGASSSAEPAVGTPPDSSHDPASPYHAARWAEFHAFVDRLPPDEREAFDILWYQELSPAEAAELLDVSERTVRRRYTAARRRLLDLLGGRLPF